MIFFSQYRNAGMFLACLSLSTIFLVLAVDYRVVLPSPPIETVITLAAVGSVSAALAELMMFGMLR